MWFLNLSMEVKSYFAWSRGRIITLSKPLDIEEIAKLLSPLRLVPQSPLVRREVKTSDVEGNIFCYFMGSILHALVCILPFCLFFFNVLLNSKRLLGTFNFFGLLLARSIFDHVSITLGAYSAIWVFSHVIREHFSSHSFFIVRIVKIMIIIWNVIEIILDHPIHLGSTDICLSNLCLILNSLNWILVTFLGSLSIPSGNISTMTSGW